MRCQRFDVVNYIDDFVGFGTPDVARHAYDCLYNILGTLDLTVSQKKLFNPGTRVPCLGVIIDMVDTSISIPEEKLQQIKQTVAEWGVKKTCTRHQLQSLLGQLLYIHKCVKLARLFVNRMLQLLRINYANSTIVLTGDLFCDLNWFSRFLTRYNGRSFIVMSFHARMLNLTRA